jgi:arsenite/tail-anchored protein-transporting ATPase
MFKGKLMNTQFIFFSGKGGVGKTSMACATAVRHADAGKRTLIITTDPAANLADVFEQPIGHHMTPLTGIANLWAMEIDPDSATEEYKERALAPLRDIFPAPTGHTLRMLELPMDWSKQIDVKAFASVDTAVVDDIAKQRFADVIDMMCSPERSTFAFVMYPESTPIVEAYRASQELATLDIPTGLAVANFVIPAEQADTPFTKSRRAMQAGYLAEIQERFDTPVLTIPLLPQEVQGLEMLAELGEQMYGELVIV